MSLKINKYALLGIVSGIFAVAEISVSAAEDKSAPLANNESSLTDYIQKDTPTTQENKSETAAERAGTWAGNLLDKVREKGSQAFNKKEENAATQIKRSNASVFDISGIMLRMDLAQVTEAMQKRGYRKTSAQLEIPNFIRWRYDEQCRNKGIVGYERTAGCVVRLAQKNNYQYVQHISFSNFQTKENIDVFLTSNFTGNKVYRVMYQTEAANIKGNGPKVEYLRNLKIFDFWKKINQKYGKPDNPDRVTWGLGENKPSLQAATGRLILHDPMLLELDYSRMAREDQKFMNTATYTF
ncbi:MAG: hypothetical protein IJ770_00715 [Alphaproteobacteria bacterium]|nr:hypothetical protein [Alphaproteobacteria bacterium]